MSQLGQAPKPAENAAFLHPTSVTGGKVDFVQYSDVSDTSFVVPANDSRALTVNLFVYDDVGNLLDFEEALPIYHYLDAYIDTNLDPAYEHIVGASLSVGQRKIVVSPYKPAGGGTASLRSIYRFFNNDASDHTIYVSSLWYFIRIA